MAEKIFQQVMEKLERGIETVRDLKVALTVG